ncbi:hypothetical protein [Halopiger djelfimassiliensis]|uniref:hypothetical protein n=1 Tax=Halopiger djelfimassiliensis TaxID=1293047 RepID=UPI0006778AC7|nr:hypothetical protein [Halopiger djelfimassiliensis]
MNRRQYLGYTGSGLAVVACAGCLGDFGGDSSGVEVDDRTGKRELSRAVGGLNDAAIALDTGDELEDPESVDFDPEEPRTHLEQARDHLETAADELPDDRAGDIEELRAYADVLEGLIDVTATVTDETLADDAAIVTDTIVGEGDLDDARTTVDERTAAIETAATRFDETNAALQDLDAERLEELAVVDLEEVEAGAAALGDAVDSLAALGDGYDAMLAGYAALERGREHADADEHDRAETEFADAESEFETAVETLESGAAESPSGFASYFETAGCQSGHLRTAAEHFAAASAAAADRNAAAARRNRADAEAALEDADACTDD